MSITNYTANTEQYITTATDAIHSAIAIASLFAIILGTFLVGSNLAYGVLSILVGEVLLVGVYAIESGGMNTFIERISVGG